MMKRALSIAALVVTTFLCTLPVFAVDTAPRISDREIIEKLSALDAKIDKEIANVRGDIKELKAGQKALEERFDDVNRRIDDMNKRFDTLQWMLGLFITVALSLMGIMGRILWNQHKKMAQFETSMETQKDELAFLKSLIEKLLPPKGVL